MSIDIQDITNKMLLSTAEGDQSREFQIFIDGFHLPPHSKFKVELEDLYEDGWRDQQGYQHGQLIRKDVRKIFLEWQHLNAEDVKYILDLVSKKQYMEVSYPNDPLTGERHTITAYRGAVSVPEHGTYKGYMIWESLSFNLIER